MKGLDAASGSAAAARRGRTDSRPRHLVLTDKEVTHPDTLVLRGETRIAALVATSHRRGGAPARILQDIGDPVFREQLIHQKRVIHSSC
ncbi:hypothetical protein [Fontivita pretiosa]|uniref:hypothetical protein n=1 Tax=Fontivita pretiosa TaxID=2989684 RepID=UPI003D16C353